MRYSEIKELNEKSINKNILLHYCACSFVHWHFCKTKNANVHRRKPLKINLRGAKPCLQCLMTFTAIPNRMSRTEWKSTVLLLVLIGQKHSIQWMDGTAFCNGNKARRHGSPTVLQCSLVHERRKHEKTTFCILFRIRTWCDNRIYKSI